MSLLEEGYHQLRSTAKRSRVLRKLYHTYRAHQEAPLPAIRQEEIDAKIRAGAFHGIVHPQVGQERVIVSLTSYPARLEEIHYTLYSLLNQELPLSAIKLWLIAEEYPLPLSADALPKSLRAMEKHGVEIGWIHDNIRSYAKLLPTLEREPEAVIITADDDVYYPTDWASRLYRTHLAHPEDIIAHRAHWVTYEKGGRIASYGAWPKCIEGGSCRFANFQTGVGGVLYPSGSLHADVSRRELYQKLAPKADDIWFWAMAVRNHRKIRVPEDAERTLVYDSVAMQTGADRLSAENVDGGGNDPQLRAVLDAFPEIEEILQDENKYNILTNSGGVRRKSYLAFYPQHVTPLVPSISKDVRAAA